MADRARCANARAQRRQEAVDVLAAVSDPIDEDDSDDNEEIDEAHVRVLQRRVRGPAMAPLLAFGSRNVVKHLC